MTISSLALAAKKVIEAAWLHGTAYDLASQAAFALESAQLLQSPETAQQLEQLRARVAELVAERHVTNEALSEAAEALRENRDRFAALEQQTAGEPLPVMVSPREPVEDLYDYQRHHSYRLGRDLPPLDGVR